MRMRARLPPNSMVLHEDLVLEILSWLSVKSLMRFRCVCKSWKSLIFHSTFIKLHLQRSSKRPNLLLSYRPRPRGDCTTLFAVSCTVPSFLHNPFLPLAKHGYSFPLKFPYFILGSCNGLVCLYKNTFSNRENVKLKEICFRFWNPAMRLRSKKSPCLRVSFKVNGHDPSRFGLGYDDSSDSYKIVAVILGSENTTVQVFRLGDTCWRTILTFPVFPIVCFQHGQFTSGTVNWLALDKVGVNEYGWYDVAAAADKLMIFSLHLGKETYRHLSLPHGIKLDCEFPCQEPMLGVLRDCLCLFYSHRGTHFFLWQMKEFGVQKSWTQLANLHFDDYVKPICLSDNDDVMILLSIADSKIILYNRRDNKVLRIGDRPAEIWFNVLGYVQSLVSPC